MGKGSQAIDLKIDTVEVWGSSPHLPADVHGRCRRRVTLQYIPAKCALYLRSVCVPNGALEA